jgi:hypothetical protein
MSYSRNRYRCLLKPHNQNVIVSLDNNIQPNPIPNPNLNPHFYPCIDPYPDIGPYYPGYPCIGPYPYAQKMEEEPDQNQPSIPKPTPPIPKPTPQPRLYPYGPYSGVYPYGPYSGVYPGYYSGAYGGPYYPGVGPYYPGVGPFPYSQTKENIKSKNAKPKNENVGNIGNMKPHCEYYSSSSSSSSSSSDSDRYRRRYRRYAKVSGETETKVAERDRQVFDLEKEYTEKDSNRVFDEQNQKPYPIPKPRPKPPDPKPILIEEVQERDKKSFAKPLANLFTKFTTPEKEPENELIQVIQDEKNEKNEQKIYLKV